MNMLSQQNLNDILLEEVKKKISPAENLAYRLMDILSVGRESIYRRLRGDVSFTFEEVVKIANAFGISIDNIIGMNNPEQAVFNINFLSYNEPITAYKDKIQSFIDFVEVVLQAKHQVGRYVLNHLPYNIYLAYENIVKFKYFKWLYQSSNLGYSFKFEDLHLPQDVDMLHRKYMDKANYIEKSIFIIDRNMFLATIYDIEYFYTLKLLSEDSVLLLKKELLSILDDFEYWANTGSNTEGKEILIYLSNIDLETSYAHFEYDDRQNSFFRLYGMEGINSDIEDICNKQKTWIESLKRYSTLITQSGEMQREVYFSEQKKIIANMCTHISYIKTT